MARVEFRVDGVLIGTDSSAPYTGTWNAASAAVGCHTILATAYDVAGNSASASVAVSVPAPADTTPPTVLAHLSPPAGATVSGIVAIAATASDTGSGVARVEFRADGVLIGTDSSAPYTGTWNAASAAVGSHTILATAYDVAGNSASASVAVSVPAPADTTPPVLAISSPTAGSTVSGSVAIAATASDTGSGVARVEFRADGVLIGTDTSAPYTGTWNAASAAVGLPHDPRHRLRRGRQLVELQCLGHRPGTGRHHRPDRRAHLARRPAPPSPASSRWPPPPLTPAPAWPASSSASTVCWWAPT